MLPAHQDLITAFHGNAARWVLAITGGGATAAGDLLSVPGGSRTLLEVVIPYHEQALAEFLGRSPGEYCSAETSRLIARRALQQAEWLTPGEHVFGLGCTASLVSDRPKRGDHRVHISTAGAGKIRTWSLSLIKGARDRFDEENVVAHLILLAMAHTLGIPPSEVPLLVGEKIDATAGPLDDILESLIISESLYIAQDGQLRPDFAWNRAQPMVLVPGAFNPLHRAHRKLAALVAILEDKPAVFELSMVNVDKPELGAEEVRRRLTQFTSHAPVWLTRAAHFTDKARLFPGATFAIGADTAQRLVDPRYYGNEEQILHQACDFLRKQGCHFLVAGRIDAESKYLELADIAIPDAFRDLFHSIPADVFRMDISSTLLRKRVP